MSNDPRHRKESIIISSDGVSPPTYTDELYPWLLHTFDVEPVDAGWTTDSIEQEIDQEVVEDRLENLGYL